MEAETFLGIGVLVAAILVIVLFRIAVVAFFHRTRFLSVCPRVTEGSETIVARTSLKGFIISLTMLFRVVVIDRRRGTVEIQRRLLWFFKRRRTIAFEDVDKILYSYEDWSVTSALDISGDTLDSYTVKLRLRSDEEVHLFRFFGEGEFQRGVFLPWDSWLPDWFYWPQRVFDMSGAQEADSRRFVELLKDCTGATISPG